MFVRFFSRYVGNDNVYYTGRVLVEILNLRVDRVAKLHYKNVGFSELIGFPHGVDRELKNERSVI